MSNLKQGGITSSLVYELKNLKNKSLLFHDYTNISLLFAKRQSNKRLSECAQKVTRQINILLELSLAYTNTL